MQFASPSSFFELYTADNQYRNTPFYNFWITIMIQDTLSIPIINVSDIRIDARETTHSLHCNCCTWLVNYTLIRRAKCVVEPEPVKWERRVVVPSPDIYHIINTVFAQNHFDCYPVFWQCVRRLFNIRYWWYRECSPRAGISQSRTLWWGRRRTSFV